MHQWKWRGAANRNAPVEPVKVIRMGTAPLTDAQERFLTIAKEVGCMTPALVAALKKADILKHITLASTDAPGGDLQFRHFSLTKVYVFGHGWARAQLTRRVFSPGNEFFSQTIGMEYLGAPLFPDSVTNMCGVNTLRKGLVVYAHMLTAMESHEGKRAVFSIAQVIPEPR